MRRLINEFQRFGRDERGAFAVLFGVIAIVLIATSGAVVDFTSLEQARTRSQTALDAAALALQPQIYTLPAGTRDAQLKGFAQEILTDRLNDDSITATVTTVTSNTVDGTLKLVATVTKGTSFVGLIGIPNITASLVSEATRRQLDLEVAMVLDNSGSMSSSSRMTNLKKAARCATNILFNSIASCTDAALTAADPLLPTVPNTKIGIVPFNEFVNVGTGYKNATWMDQTGKSKVSMDGFDRDDSDANGGTTDPVNRFGLYTTLGITWKGCVEARNRTTGTDGLYYDTSDLPPDPLIPDSLFAPTFAQDQAPGFANDYLNDRPAACTNHDQGYWTKTIVKTGCDKDGDNNANNFNTASCSTTTGPTYTQKNKDGGNVTPAATTEPASVNGQPAVCTDNYTGVRSPSNSNPRRYTNTYERVCSYSFSNRELHERLCKYAANNASYGNFGAGPGGRTGPNADCGVALLPLTLTKSQVISKISAMTSSGGTNIHQGVMWGLHMLSPTEPLTEAKVYAGSTSKVMIVMTDGENTHAYTNDYAGANWYTAYGYPYQGRLDTSPRSTAAFQTEMDNRTKETCTNAKAANIVIYTIGLSAPNQTTIDMLTACASEPAKAYFPTSATQLVDTFKAIASQLADLRLAR